MDVFYTGLLANFGILAMCGLVLSSVTPIWRDQNRGQLRYQIVVGLIFGLSTATLILFSTSLPGGSVFDSRAAPAILSGVIGGPWAALVTAVLGGASRAFIGGDWVVPGVISVVLYCVLGLTYTFALKRLFRKKMSPMHLAPLGAISTILAAPVFFIGMPFEAAAQLVEAVFVTLFITNALSVFALGFALLNSVQTRADRDELLLMHAAVKRAASGVIIAEAGGDRKIVFANDAVTKITEYTPAELIGQSADVLIGPGSEIGDRRALLSAYKHGLEGSGTLLSHRKGGEAFHNQVNIAPVFSSGGKITHWIGVIADVSQEMQVKNVLETVSGQIPTALIYLNRASQVEFINAAGQRLLGLEDLNVKRRPLYEVVPVQALDVLAPFIVEAEKGQEARSECKLPLCDGSEVDTRMTSAPTVAENGAQVGVIISIEDISHYKRMEQALAQSERLQSIGTLTGGIAHDFNNLNTVVIGNLDLLKLSGDTEDTSEYVDEALAAARRGAKLTQSLLSFGRKAHLRPDRIDLANGLTDLENLLRASIKASTLLEFDHSSAPLEVHVDQTNLESAILNLVVNADHAIGEAAGAISVSFQHVQFDAPLNDGAFAGDFEVDALGAFAAIKVTDTGSGVPAASRDRIIEPFYTTKGRHSGTGLGLAMAHGFVRQSGGFMRISDGHPTGTVVSLYLPLADGKHGANVIATDTGLQKMAI